MPPPVALATGARRSAVARRSDSSTGLTAPEATSTVFVPSSSRYRPVSSVSTVALESPPPAARNSTVRVAPEGALTVTRGRPRLRLRRSMTRRPSRMRPRRPSSSRSGSFISQWASRRRSSAWGPPPSKPRAHSQMWSLINWATRPFPTRSRISNGLSSRPCMSTTPVPGPASTCRNQRPHLGVSALPSTRAAVTGWRRPTSVSAGTKPRSSTRPVGLAGITAPRGLWKRLRTPANSGPTANRMAPPWRRYFAMLRKYDGGTTSRST